MSAEQLDLFSVAANTLHAAELAAVTPAGADSPTANPPATDRQAAEPKNQPPDHDARTMVAERLDTNLFISAGAGSGKTTAVVARVVNLVRSGVPIGEIAAITFTEKAAAELRHRIRQALLAAQPTEAAGVAAALALGDLDRAPIGTLHAFARRVLSEFPVESGLPPRFDVLDEVQSANAFAERFADFMEELLDRTASVRIVELCEYDTFRVEPGIRRMAEDFQANWDLVEERVDPSPPVPVDARDDLDELLARCAAIAATDVPPDDRQSNVVANLRITSQRLRDATTLGETLAALVTLAEAKGAGGGDKSKWKRHGSTDEALEALREAHARVASDSSALLVRFNDERRLTLGALLRAFTLGAVEQRRQDGALEFHDLLVLARRLVCEHPGVRRELHDRYTHILLDEFQDTDPIQLELAVRLAADPSAPAETDWRRLQPLPGRLCLVGDPKQSIYRFRRADIGQFLAARDRIGATQASLSANFRSTPAVIDWVNHTMGRLIHFEPDVQPPYEPLDPCRGEAQHAGSVVVLGAQPHEDSPTADQLREREAQDVAATVVRALDERWLVGRPDDVDEPEDRDAPSVEEQQPCMVLTPCRPSDIAILLPARTSLPALQAALAARGIAYRAENSSLVYATPEIRALLLALRAADDPTDELAIASTLRTPLYGCSDVDLYEWRVVHDLRWSGRQDVPSELAAHPVAVALASLGALRDAIPTSTPAQLLTRLVDERSVLELALASAHSRDVWRRVRFVIDQARAWSEAGGHGVRHYLAWTRAQGEDGRFVAETVLAESDHDAVRVMTVHAAKGLEFPITIVSGLTTRPGGRKGRRVVWPNGKWALTEPTDGVYEEFAPLDELMSDAERRRLLYVATTRARDHLVISLHRTGSANGRSSAALLADCSTGAGHVEAEGYEGRMLAPTVAASELAWAEEAGWEAARAEALARASTATVLSATALAKRFAAGEPVDAAMRKDAVDLDLPPWQRGRYGTAIGRAVHAVLQYVDLRDAHDLPTLAVAQAAAEGVLGMELTVERLARSALGADVVATGVRHEHWRELFVATAFGAHVVEGYIDLLVRHPDRGLIVVDYKTDQLDGVADRHGRLARYGVQLAAYGIALESLLHEPVSGGVLVMCRTSGAAEEVDVADWAQLQAELRRTLLAPS